MLKAPVEWARYLEASMLLSPLLVEALSSNLYPGGKEGYQASCGSILRHITVRLGKVSLPPYTTVW